MSAPSGYSSSQLAFDDAFAGSSLSTNNWNTYWTSRAANGYPWNANLYPTGGSGDSLNHTYDSYFMPSQVKVSNGLDLTMVPNSQVSGMNYVAGAVTSYGHFQLTSGYVQVLAKMPDSSTGAWPAIWFLPGPGGTGGDRGEIDLQEGGFLPSNVGLPSTPVNHIFVSHYFEPNSSTVVASYDTGVDMTAGYHTYGMEYKPGVSVKTYFDGHLVGNWTTKINTDPYEIIINNGHAANSTSGWHTTGSVSSSDFYIKEVQAYQ
jgi:beta-glucanase (GH16 family)